MAERIVSTQRYEVADMESMLEEQPATDLS